MPEQIEIIVTVNDRASGSINVIAQALNKLASSAMGAISPQLALDKLAISSSKVAAASSNAAAAASRAGGANNNLAATAARLTTADNNAAAAILRVATADNNLVASAGRAITATNNAAAAAARNATAYNNLSISAARLVTANNAVAISASRVITAQNTAAASASRAAIAAANAGIASQLAAARLATAQANAAMATNRLNESLQSSRTALANLGNQAQTTSRHMGGMLSMVKGVLVAMAVFEVMRIPPMLISTAVQAYAEYERLGLTLKNLLSVELMQADASLLMRDAMGQVGEKSKELIDWTEKLAILSPFTQETVAYTLQTLMGYGMASDMAQKLTQGLADYAAGTGRSEEQTKLLGLALGQVWAKGKLTGEEMRQLTNAGMGVELMATAAGMSLETFTDVMKEGEMDARKLIPRLIELTDERFAGAAKAQATSWAGLLSTMQDITKIGLQTFFTETLQGIQPYLADFLDAWPQFKENLASAGREFADFGANSVRILGELKDKWTDMGTEGQNQIIIVATLIAAPGALGIAIRSAQGALAILGFAFTGLLGKVTLVIGAVMALGTVLRKAAEPTLTWGEAFEKTWGPALQEVGASSKRAALELQKMMDPNSSAGMQIALQDTTEQIEKQIVKVDDLQVALIKVGQVAKIRPDFQVDISRNPLVQMFRPAAEALRILNEEYDQEKAKLDDLRLSAKNVAAALKTSTDGAFDLGRAMKYAADMGIPLAEAIQKALSHKTIEMPGMEELAKAWIQVNGETELMFASTDALIRNYERLNNVSIKVAGSQATIGSAARSTYPPLVVVGDATKAAGKAAEDAAAQYEKMIESMRNIIASSSDIITYLISIDPAAMAAAAAVDTLRLRLVGLQDQQAGLQESIKASQAVLRAMQDTVSRLGDALAAAKSKLADLAAPKLKGMGELDDQMAAIERQLNRLKMVDLMIPSLADIKNQFKDLARVTTEGGVTVTNFGLTDAEAQAKLSELRKNALAEIKKQFPEMTKGMEDYLATLPDTADGLQKILEKLRLTKELKFDEQLKKIADAANGVKDELTFDEAIAQIAATKDEIGNLEGQLSAAKLAAELQTQAIAAMQAASEEMTKAIQQMQRDLAEQERRQKLVNDALKLAYDWFVNDRLKLIAMGDEGVRQAGIIDEATRDLLSTTTTYAQGEASAAITAIQAAVNAYLAARAQMTGLLGGGGAPDLGALRAEWERQRLAAGEDPNDEDAWQRHKTAIGLASGTRSWAGGMALVGEQGPELVNLPRGSQVYPSSVTNQMLWDMGIIDPGMLKETLESIRYAMWRMGRKDERAEWLAQIMFNEFMTDFTSQLAPQLAHEIAPIILDRRYDIPPIGGDRRYDIPPIGGDRRYDIPPIGGDRRYDIPPIGGPTYILNLRTEQSSMGIIQDWAYLKMLAGA